MKGTKQETKDGKFTIHIGEAMAHAHVLESDAEVYELDTGTKGVKTFLVPHLPVGSKLVHRNIKTQELTTQHDTYTVEKAGTYIFGTQRNLDHEGKLRPVTD